MLNNDSLSEKNDSFSEFVRTYRADLYRYCRSRTGNDTFLADEVLSVTLAVLYKKWDTLERGENIKAYAFKVANLCAKNVMKNHARYYRRNSSLEAALSEGVLKDEEYYDKYFADDTPVSEYLERIEGALNEEDRLLFRLGFVEKKSSREISGITGMPYTTVRYRLFKIESAVREEIKNIFK